MSVIDQLPPAKRKLTAPIRRDFSRDFAAVLARVAGLLAPAWARLRSDRPLRLALVWGIASWVLLQFAFVVWVHRNLEGVSHRAFLPGVLLGLSEFEKSLGLQPVCKIGFDGQQYYRISNDIFARHDPSPNLSGAIYRYQRVGVPMLSGGLATILGYKVTPPLLYHTVQFGLVAVGFSALIYWLTLNGLNPAYALGWLLAGGTTSSLWLGVADAPGDAFFVLTFLALVSRRLWLYVPLATLLLLTREGYSVYAFAIFAITATSRLAWQDGRAQWRPFPRFPWRDVTGYWKPVMLTALPGGIMLAWTIYLQIQFHTSAIEARNDPNMQSWPFLMLFNAIREFYRARNWAELRLCVASAFTLILVTVLLVRNWRRLPLALACTLPYVLLVASLGKYTWEDNLCYLRVLGAPIIVGLFLLPIDKSLLLRFMLMLQAIVGVDLLADARLMHSRILSPYLIHEEGYDANPADAPENPLLNDMRNSLEWVNSESVCRPKYHGIWSGIHREIKPVTVAVTNRTNVTWQPGRGKHPLWLGYTLYDGAGTRQLAQRSVILDKSIAPGETKEVTAYLELLRPGRKYVVEFSLWQEGPGWFAGTDPALGRRYEFMVE